LERELDIKCFQYNIEPNREDVELLGSVKAQNQKIDALARMAVDAIRRDNTLEKGLWIYVDPPYRDKE
jgi:16S rRNA G966 N2-methylase RsmD